MTDEEDLPTLVSRRLRELGLTYRAAERRTGRDPRRRSGYAVSNTHIGAIANGTHRGLVTEETLQGLALALDLPISQLRAAAGVSTPTPRRVPRGAEELTDGQWEMIEKWIKMQAAENRRLTRDRKPPSR